MKKSLLFAAAALATLTASAQNKTWNFSDMFTDTQINALVEAGNIVVGDDGKGNVAYNFKGECTVDGLTFYSNYTDAEDVDGKAGKWSLQNGKGASANGELTFTYTLKSGGISSWYGQPTEEDAGLPEAQWTPKTRMLSFEVDGPCDILLYYVSANTSATDRYAQLFYQNAENDLGLYYASSPSSAIMPWHYRYTGEAGKIIVFVNGINMYGIEIKPATEQPDVKEVYTYCEIAEGSLNPDNLSDDGSLGKINMSPAMPAGGFEYGTEVTFTYTGANDFALDHWYLPDTDETFPKGALKLTVGDDWTEVIAVVTYVDPFNAIPGYLNGYTAKSGSIRNWANESTVRGICCIKLSDGLGDDPSKEEYSAHPWPAAGINQGYDWPALTGPKGTASWEFQVRAMEAGEYNLVAAVSNKQGGEGQLSVTVFAGDNADGDIVAEGNAVVPVTYQDWNYIERKVELDGALEAGVYYVRITEVSGDSGRAPQMLYAIMGIGDNYGDWATIDPSAGVENVTVDGVNGPVRYFNLQGIEVNADAKGLLILSNGTKVLNK